MKKLIDHGSKADDTQVFTLSFMSGVLRFTLPNQILFIPAQGKDWSETYVCLLKGLAHISNKTPSEGIHLGIWKSELVIGR